MLEEDFLGKDGGEDIYKSLEAREREHRVFREQKIVQFIKVTTL